LEFVELLWLKTLNKQPGIIMEVDAAAAGAVVVGMVDMVGEAMVIAITVTAPTIPIMMVGPMPTMAAATAMSMNQIPLVAQGKMSSLSSPRI
jgi:hypothetical protein